jgi:MFS family permease
VLAATAALLRTNPAYRRLWAAQVVSLTGDWFTLIALSVLVARDSGGSGLAVSGIALAQMVPWVLVGPWSGVLADRFDRKRLLVLSDLARVGVVLLLVPAAEAHRLPVVLALAVLHFALASVFEPARSALVPRLVEPHQLVTATTLSSVTWSVMLAAGGLVGGAVLSRVGLRTAFVLDALTFLVSAGLIVAIRSPPRAVPEAPRERRPAFRQGIAWALEHPEVGAAALVKVANGVAAVEIFIVLYATRVFPVGEGGAFSVGFLCAAFGLGAIAGPLSLNRLNDGSVRRMRRLIVASSALLSVALFALGAAGSLLAAGAAIFLRGMGGSANWTFSTIILQKGVPDRLLGRLSALDLVNANLAGMLFSIAWGTTVDTAGLRAAVFAAAAATLLPLGLWAASLPWLEKREGTA